MQLNLQTGNRVCEKESGILLTHESAGRIWAMQETSQETESTLLNTALKSIILSNYHLISSIFPQFERYRHRERMTKISQLLNRLSNIGSGQGKVMSKSESWDSTWISHTGGRNWSPWAITAASQGLHEQEAGINSGARSWTWTLWDAELVLASMPTAHSHPPVQ